MAPAKKRTAAKKKTTVRKQVAKKRVGKGTSSGGPRAKSK